MTDATTMRPRGFTLIELLITLAIAAVMLVLAAPGLQTLLANQRLTSAADSLQASVLQARSTALRDNRRVIVQPLDGDDSDNSGDWKNGWHVYIDAAQNSTFDSGTDTVVLTQEALPAEITIARTTSGKNFIGFDGTGFLAQIGGSANATWKISSTGTAREKYLVIERSGRARLCDPKLVANCPS